MPPEDHNSEKTESIRVLIERLCGEVNTVNVTLGMVRAEQRQCRENVTGFMTGLDRRLRKVERQVVPIDDMKTNIKINAQEISSLKGKVYWLSGAAAAVAFTIVESVKAGITYMKGG